MSFRAAAVQLCTTGHKPDNLATAARLVDDAAARGAQLVVLPEMFNCLGPGEVLAQGAEPFDGPTLAFAREAGARHGIWLVAGSFVERHEGGRRTSNTSVLISPSGEVAARYSKIHLFDCDVAGAEFRESDVVEPGTHVVTADTCPDIGRVGLSICYDLRFPELYRIGALQGATTFAVPAAFTARTGPPHWEILLRARAIENQVFVIAAAQYGESAAGLRWHGHSMIVDPWGTVLASAPGDAGECVVVADLDTDEQQRVRRALPSLANRQPAAYVWP